MTAETVELRRSLRAHDLAYLAGKKRQSPRTGFVHLFHGQETAADTIPLYENFCYALALLLQKKGETILEAKKLLLRLFPFQAEMGNFPIYLHDFPLCYDFYLGLKIAPLLLRIQNFRSVLGIEVAEKIDLSLRKISFFYDGKDLTPLWEFRRAVCLADTHPQKTNFDFAQFSPSDWWEYWVTLQFIETPVCTFYHSGLQMTVGFDRLQDGFEPMPHLIDWACCNEEYPPRLLQDRPTQIQLVALDKIEVEGANPSSIHFEEGAIFWKGSRLHSLIGVNPELPPIFELGRDDLFEIAYYCDASEDVEILIDEKKGTVFTLGQRITIATPERKFSLVFTLLQGDGEFCGHVFRSNRPGQIGTTGASQYEAFDWKIALRTLRRSSDCRVHTHLTEL